MERDLFSFVLLLFFFTRFAYLVTRTASSFSFLFSCCFFFWGRYFLNSISLLRFFFLTEQNGSSPYCPLRCVLFFFLFSFLFFYGPFTEFFFLSKRALLIGRRTQKKERATVIRMKLNFEPHLTFQGFHFNKKRSKIAFEIIRKDNRISFFFNLMTIANIF